MLQHPGEQPILSCVAFPSHTTNFVIIVTRGYNNIRATCFGPYGPSSGLSQLQIYKT